MSRSNCRFLNTDTSRGRSAGWKKAQPADRPRDVCILICEELLDHLLKSGYRKIGVTVKGRKMRVIEIRAEGEEDALRTASEADDPDRFASEIKNNLLLQHSG